MHSFLQISQVSRLAIGFYNAVIYFFINEGSERMKFAKENMKQILLIIVFTALLIFALVNFPVLLALLAGYTGFCRRSLPGSAWRLS